MLIRQSRSAPLVFATLRRQVFWHWGPYNRYMLPIMTQMGTTCNPYGFSHMGSCTTVANTLSVPFGLLLWDTYYIPHYWKKVCHVLLTVIFNQRIIKAIHVLLTQFGDVTRKWGYIRFGLSVIPSFCLSFCPSVIISFPLNIFRTTWKNLPNFVCALILTYFRHDLDWFLQ